MKASQLGTQFWKICWGCGVLLQYRVPFHVEQNCSEHYWSHDTGQQFLESNIDFILKLFNWRKFSRVLLIEVIAFLCVINAFKRFVNHRTSKYFCTFEIPDLFARLRRPGPPCTRSMFARLLLGTSIVDNIKMKLPMPFAAFQVGAM